MLGIKKKLNAFIPGETARGALQNVLTVEWDGGHKTVLVQVPTAGPSRGSEMEMSGFAGGKRRNTLESEKGRRDFGYGKLEDSDEEYSGLTSASGSMFNQSRMSRSERDRDHHKTRKDNNNEKSQKPPPLPSRPSFNRPEYLDLENPFESPASSVDYFQPPKSGLSTPSYEFSRRPSDQEEIYGGGSSRGGLEYGFDDGLSPAVRDDRFSRDHRNYPYPGMMQNQHREVESSKKVWKSSDPWTAGGWSGTNSPTSSTGTRLSPTEDPFQ